METQKEALDLDLAPLAALAPANKHGRLPKMQHADVFAYQVERFRQNGGRYSLIYQREMCTAYARKNDETANEL